ncbi:MAG: aminoglycoside 6'-N-acetyltransferase [Cellulosilyticaceae bacterium]
MMMRRATLCDLEDVVKLAYMLWPEHEIDELRSEMGAIISDEKALIALGFRNDEPIGFAQCQLRYDYVEGAGSSPVGYLEGIYVDEKYRMQGMARQLLKYCEKWSREQGCAEFASDCELDNTESLHFHLKVGFVEANRIICFNKRL